MNTEQDLKNTENTEETVPAAEPVDAAQAMPAAEPPTDADLAAEVEKFRDLALRSRAELDNYRKRVIREKEEAIRYANASLLGDLLPVLDSFELGLQAAQGAGDAASILKGLEMVYKQLGDFLTAHGVEAVDAEGSPFDHNLHEAVAYEPSADVPEGNVIRQLRKGFKLKDRLIRPATVFVSKGPAEG